MTLRLEFVYGLILSCAANAQRGLTTYAGRYFIGNLRFIGFAGYDSLLGGFQIVDKRFLLHKSLLEFGVLNFTPNRQPLSRTYHGLPTTKRDLIDPPATFALSRECIRGSTLAETLASVGVLAMIAFLVVFRLAISDLFSIVTKSLP